MSRRGATSIRGCLGRPAGAATGSRPVSGAAVDRGGEADAGARRTGNAVPQPPRLCAADTVSALRAPDAVPELHRLAGGAPDAQPASVPPLRTYRADPAGMSGVFGEG